jgi:hypothetical protein
MSYICKWGKGKYHVDIVQLLKDFLYKDIPITFINNEHVVDRDHNGVNVKYFPCIFESIYVLDVTNMLEDLL